VVTANSGSVFEDVDLHEPEWVEYDETGGESLEIMELTSRITKTK
jgi:hypothetical protein